MTSKSVCPRVFAMMADFNIVIKVLAVILLMCQDEGTMSLRVSGTFDPGRDFFKFVAKFGFQKTDQLNVGQTQGFIYGNVTLIQDHLPAGIL